MFIRKPQRDEKLDGAIDSLFAELDGYTGSEEEYSAITDQIEKLYKLRNETKPKTVSADTMAIVAGNLLGILLIVGFEQTHVITSKAIGFVMKSR